MAEKGIPVLLGDLVRPRSPAARPSGKILGLASRVDGHMVVEKASAVVQERWRSLLEVGDGGGELCRWVWRSTKVGGLRKNAGAAAGILRPRHAAGVWALRRVGIAAVVVGLTQ